jgi:hypothetical protein
MLNLAAARIWLCVEPTDMRKSFESQSRCPRRGLEPER